MCPSQGCNFASASRSQAHRANMSSNMLEKEYRGPWNYCSYYPPSSEETYSGDLVLLDEREFGEASTNMAHNDYYTNSAIGLGLMEEQKEPTMTFFQLPTSLPLVKQSATAESNQITGSSRSSNKVGPSKGCRLEELPAGLMGKMLVYKSGAVKLKLGDTLYDVSPCSDCAFAQGVVAINPEEKYCSILWLLDKRAVITPNFDSLLNRMANMD